MTTEIKNPQEAAMQNIRNMLSNATQLSDVANKLMDTALRDAVAWRSNGGTGSCPVVLTQLGLNEIQHLKDGLQSFVDYYGTQIDAFGQAVGIATIPAAVPEIDPVEQLRAQTEQLTRSRGAAPAMLSSGTPTVSGARAAAAAASTLPKPSALPAAVMPTAAQANRAPLENSIARLLGDQSPLLDIFQMAPWLPNGRGNITVGSQGFQWFKGTNPFELDDNKRASLPSGFYAGEDRPQYAVIRMETCILVWNFTLDPETMLAYVAGVSDTDPVNLRWFSPISLSSTYTRRLVQELSALIPVR